MIQDAGVYSMIVKHDRVVPMIEMTEPTMVEQNSIMI